MSNISPINDLSLKVFDEILEERLKKLELHVLDLYDIDKVPSDVLPHLAEQYHITGNEGWIHADTEEKKRTLIKNAILFHRYRGTKYSIIEALKTLGYPAELTEWFEYNGEPYYFKVSLQLDKLGLNQDSRTLVIDLINSYKNVRSHLEGLNSSISSIAEPIAICVMSFSRTLEVRPYGI